VTGTCESKFEGVLEDKKKKQVMYLRCCRLHGFVIQKGTKCKELKRGVEEP